METRNGWWHCDRCCVPGGNCMHPGQFKFCPNCGAKRDESVLPGLGEKVWVLTEVSSHLGDMRSFTTYYTAAPYDVTQRGTKWISDTGSAPHLDREEYERRIANQAKLLTERTNERDDLRKTHARAMARNAEIVTDYHKFDAYLSRISDIIDERCDLSVMMMAIREVLKEWKEAP